MEAFENGDGQRICDMKHVFPSFKCLCPVVESMVCLILLPLKCVLFMHVCTQDL